MSLTGGIVLTASDIYKNDVIRKHAIGACGQDKHGDLYRYAKLATTDGVAGKLHTSLGREANHQNLALSAAAAKGAYSVAPTVGATAVDADEYVGGYMCFSDVSPEGEWYRIVSHGASAGSEAVTFYLERPLLTAATTSSEVALVRNVWNAPAISQLIAERPAGVCVIDVDVSVAPYTWLKTRGVQPVLMDTTGVTVGLKCTISDQVDGAAGLYSDVDAEFEIGQAMQTGTAGEFNPVYLTID